MKPDRNAAIAVIQAGEATMRPGLFVYITPDGFAWVEPSYREMVPSREAFHRVRGRFEMRADGFSCEGDDGRHYLVGALADLEAGQGEDMIAACAWAERSIVEAGSSMDSERDHVRQLLADELA